MAGSTPDLVAAALEPVGYLGNASNATLLVRLAGTEEHAVYKPREGERPLWDFPGGTLCQREVAAYLVSEALGWHLVPCTVLRDGPYGIGSVQRFVPHDPRRHYFRLAEEPAHHEGLARLAVFDLLVNNADRKASHVLLDGGGRIMACDHGLTFHADPKLRTVIWEFGGWPVAERWRGALRELGEGLSVPGVGLRRELASLLAPDEIAALADRARRLAELPAIPEIPEDRRPYPWPLL